MTNAEVRGSAPPAESEEARDPSRSPVFDAYDLSHNPLPISLLPGSSCYGQTHRRTGHFWKGGWIDFARKIWGSARKMNSKTNLIKQDETRKLDYIDCGKSLKNLYLHLHCPFIINIRWACTKFSLHFLSAARKIARLPEKSIILPDSGGGLQLPQPPSLYAYGQTSLQNLQLLQSSVQSVRLERAVQIIRNLRRTESRLRATGAENYRLQNAAPMKPIIGIQEARSVGRFILNGFKESRALPVSIIFAASPSNWLRRSTNTDAATEPQVHVKHLLAVSSLTWRHLAAIENRPRMSVCCAAAAGRLAAAARSCMRLIFPIDAAGRKRPPSNGNRNLPLIGYSLRWSAPVRHACPGRHRPVGSPPASTDAWLE